MTPGEWDVHWLRIREDYTNTGLDERSAGELADVDTVTEFGQRPQETP